jgi:hypothetical protein
VSDEEAERLVSRRRERIVMMICESSSARVDDGVLLLCDEFFLSFLFALKNSFFSQRFTLFLITALLFVI